MKLQRIIEKHWYLKSDLLLTILLLPLSLIYELITTIRRYLFKLKIITLGYEILIEFYYLYRSLNITNSIYTIKITIY